MIWWTKVNSQSIGKLKPAWDGNAIAPSLDASKDAFFRFAFVYNLMLNRIKGREG